MHVFPPGVKIGEGHYAWNLRKGSMMTMHGRQGDRWQPRARTAGQLSDRTAQDRGPAEPVVQITNGTRDMVKPGAAVFLMAFPKPGGGLITGAVAVGVKGAPPM